VGAWRKRCVRLSPEFSHTDNFGALLVASELFKQTPQARKVLVIFSDMRHETAAINLESPTAIAVDRFLAKADKNRLLADLSGVEVYILGVDSAVRRSAIGTVYRTSGLNTFAESAHAFRHIPSFGSCLIRPWFHKFRRSKVRRELPSDFTPT